MNTDQVLGLVRVLLQIGGTLAVAFGWVAPDKVASTTASVMAAIGPLMIAGGAIWSLFAHTDAAKVAAASQVDGVKGMTVTSDLAAAAKSTPETAVKVVPNA